MNAVPLRSWAKQGCPLSALLVNIALEARQESKLKTYNMEREIKLFLFSDNMIWNVGNPDKSKTKQTPMSNKWVNKIAKLRSAL